MNRTKAISRSKQPVSFEGVWKSFKTEFLGRPIKMSLVSTWSIGPGNIYQVFGQAYKSKISGRKIKIPTGSGSAWVGEMQDNGALKISTDNGMMTYYCKRGRKRIPIKTR
jgi:hypothetical protein